MQPTRTIDYGVRLSKELVVGISQIAASLPDWRLLEGPDSQRTVTDYRQALSAFPNIVKFTADCDRLLNEESGEGFAVLELAGLLDAVGDEDVALRTVTALASLVAAPLHAFDRWPLWKPLGTNLAIDPMRATGSGYNPMHLDIVNSTCPPDYSALLCVRPDPRGNGHSLVSQIRRAVNRLDHTEARLLATGHRRPRRRRVSGRPARSGRRSRRRRPDRGIRP